jgi:hypothetical protein
MATSVGAIATGDSMSTMAGYLMMPSDEDWLAVDFPEAGDSMPGGGEPRIELSRNDDDVFRIEIKPSCSETLGCAEGAAGARDVTSWSFTDDQSMAGDTQWSTRDVPWPSSVLVRVYKLGATGPCSAYQLLISR